MASVSEPVVLLYKSDMCHHSKQLMHMWDDIITEIKSVYPKLRFHVLTSSNNSGKFDENVAPKSLIKYAKWFPMILLVPGKVWDEGMSNLGPENGIEIKEGVQIMNGVWKGDDFKYEQKYNNKRVGDYMEWIKDGLNNEEFKRVQE